MVLVVGVHSIPGANSARGPSMSEQRQSLGSQLNKQSAWVTQSATGTVMSRKREPARRKSAVFIGAVLE